jgi:hypothetical protein
MTGQVKYNVLVKAQETLTMGSPQTEEDEAVMVATTIDNDDSDITATINSDEATAEQDDQVNQTTTTTATAENEATPAAKDEPVQAGPLIDLFGTKLQSLQMVDEQNARISEHYTNDALRGKDVIGIYFSADWYVPLTQKKELPVFGRFDGSHIV